MTLLTHEQLEVMLPGARDADLIKFLSPINLTLLEFKIDTPLRIAAFIAQIGHESGSLRYVEEIASGKAYELRADLGNLDKIALEIAHANYSTTGVFYKGRGLIQITGYTNYVACSLGLGIDCVRKPRLLSEPLNAARSAGWFWSTKDLNKKADLELFTSITKRINGGTYGAEDRNDRYALCKEVMGC